MEHSISIIYTNSVKFLSYYQRLAEINTRTKNCLAGFKGKNHIVDVVIISIDFR